MDIANYEKEKKLAKLQIAEAEYRAGVISVNAIAHKHGIPESTLRREAKLRGWIRSAPEARRHQVALSLCGEVVASEMANDSIMKIQADALAQDVEDMNSGLAVARQVIKKLLPLAEQLNDPRDLKVIVEANRAAIETIRKIRSLDEPSPPPIAQAVSMTVTDGFDELRAAFKRVIAQHAGRTHNEGD